MVTSRSGGGGVVTCVFIPAAFTQQTRPGMRETMTGAGVAGRCGWRTQMARVLGQFLLLAGALLPKSHAIQIFLNS